MKEHAVDLDHELSLHPHLLFDLTFSAKELWFLGNRLGDPARSIDVQRISNADMMPFPAGATVARYKDKKTYYSMNDQWIEYPLAERITAALNAHGWLRTQDGINYRIRHSRIVEVRITTPLLDYYQTITKADIQDRFGPADQVIEQYDDLGIDTTRFVYHERMMRIYYRDWTSKIEGINIGESLIDYASGDPTAWLP
jgi:hypothetical protein